MRCTWEESSIIYSINTAMFITLFILYIGLSVRQYLSIKQVIKSFTVYNFLMEAIRYISSMFLVFTIDTSVSALIDIHFVGLSCAFVHYMYTINTFLKLTGLVIFLGWKILFVLFFIQNNKLIIHRMCNFYSNSAQLI